MITYNVPINAKRMTIGVQGEDNVREFLFDVTEWRQLTGDVGTAEMVVQRRGDSSPYAAAITMHDENTVSWVPTAADTAKAGAGKIQLMWIAEGQTVKTKIFDMKVDPALDYQLPDDSLDPWASWVPDVINAAAAIRDFPGIAEEIELLVIASPIRGYCVALITPDRHCTLMDLNGDAWRLSGDNIPAVIGDDLDYNAAAGYVIDALNGRVNNVDAVIITHYHWDHRGDLDTLFGDGGLPCKDMKLYLPEVPGEDSAAPAEVKTAGAEMEAWAEEHGFAVVHPTEGGTANVNGILFTFHNCDISVWDQRAASSADGYVYNYNDTSLAILAEWRHGRIYNVGDAYWPLQEWLCDGGYVCRADILLAPHHGMSYVLNPDFMAQVSPQAVIGQFGNMDLLDAFVTQRWPELSSGDRETVKKLINPGIYVRDHMDAAADWSSMYGVPYYDTVDNGTFSLFLGADGTIHTEGVTPYMPNGELVEYPSFNSAARTTGKSLSYLSGILDVLESMPNNSKVRIWANGNYQVTKDLKLPGNGTSTRYYVIEIAKFVGGSTNDLFNRTNPDRYVFQIRATTAYGIADEEYLFSGRITSAGVLTVGVEKFVPMIHARYAASAAAGAEAVTLSADANRSSNRDLITLVDGDHTKFTVARTALFEIMAFGAADGQDVVVGLYNGATGVSFGYNIPLPAGIANTRRVSLPSNTQYTIKITKPDGTALDAAWSGSVFLRYLGTVITGGWPGSEGGSE